jgi:hypothetical protein
MKTFGHYWELAVSWARIVSLIVSLGLVVYIAACWMEAGSISDWKFTSVNWKRCLQWSALVVMLLSGSFLATKAAGEPGHSYNHCASLIVTHVRDVRRLSCPQLS